MGGWEGDVPSCDALEEEVIGNDQVHHLVDAPGLGGQHFVQLFWGGGGSG